VVWNSKGTGLADVVEKFCKKGDRIYVEGRIEYRQWQDKENQTRYSTEVNVREMLMLGGGRGAQGGGDFDGEGSGKSRAPAAAGAKAGAAGAGGADFEDFPGALQDGDDDLPF
jgi:single-strand DNA-binding protein